MQLKRLTTDIDNVSEIAHIRVQQHVADRAKRRAAVKRVGQSYLHKSREFLKTVNNKMLVPTSFSPTN